MFFKMLFIPIEDENTFQFRLRGNAIIEVLLFHLQPTSFPNGYVGGDM